ncbi:TetR family transcriptional regulator [Actinoplanes sp. NPDC051343]|jgi:AcrR family transcriptional regulator|uniref:TetR family transcriptional regulator n=1 Tax=Actinoplanes sp. NPDC051343 TaxID=3363906 RepID=UPI0037A7A898
MRTREANRARRRAALLAAARGLTIERGWAAVRMVDVATVTGLSRQTVYNEFGGRTGLADALVTAEVTRFVQTMRTDFFGSRADSHRAVETAALHAIRAATGNRLVHERQLFPRPPTRLVLDPAAAVIREWAATYHPDCPSTTVELAAESVVRLTLSHLLLPLAAPEKTAATLADVFVRLLN